MTARFRIASNGDAVGIEDTGESDADVPSVICWFTPGTSADLPQVVVDLLNGGRHRPWVEIHTIGGNCPVQAEGTVGGKPFYFRARGSSWSMSIGGADPADNPEWSHEEDYGTRPYDAGWMPFAEAKSFIHQAAQMFADKIEERSMSPGISVEEATQAVVEAAEAVVLGPTSETLYELGAAVERLKAAKGSVPSS